MAALVGYWRITEVDDAWDIGDELDIHLWIHFGDEMHLRATRG